MIKRGESDEIRPLDQLTPHPEQAAIYGDLPDNELQALKLNIEEFGLQQPVVITREGLILDGHQRVKVAKLLGWTHIGVVIAEGTPVEHHNYFLRANLDRRQLDHLAKARVIKAIAESESEQNGHRQKKIEFRDHLAQQLGGNICGRTVGRYLKLLTLPRPVQDAVSHSALTMTLALKVAGLPTQHQEKIAAKIANGESPKSVISEYFPSRRPKDTDAASESEDTPADLYWMFIDFVEKELDNVIENIDTVVGKATTHHMAAELLDRAASFCVKMRDLELAAHSQAISNIRAKCKVD